MRIPKADVRFRYRPLLEELEPRDAPAGLGLSDLEFGGGGWTRPSAAADIESLKRAASAAAASLPPASGTAPAPTPSSAPPAPSQSMNRAGTQAAEREQLAQLTQAVSPLPGQTPPPKRNPPPAAAYAPWSQQVAVPINCDNDNHSPLKTFAFQGQQIPYWIPTVRDYDAGQTAAENDLVALPVEWLPNSPGGGPAPIPPPIAMEYRITLTQPAVGGRVKLWSFADKSGALLADGQWHVGWFDTVMVEGVEPSHVRDEIAITLFRREIFQDGSIIETFSQNFVVTVTPVLEEFTLNVTAPTFTNGVDPGGEFAGAMTLSASVYGSGLLGSLQMVQNLTAVSNNLNGGTAGVMLKGGTFEALVPWAGMPGPNKSFPFLDLNKLPPPQPRYYDPYYVPDIRTRESLTASDAPFLPAMGNEPLEAMKVVQINISKFFWSWIVWEQFDEREGAERAAQAIIYPLAYWPWELTFRAIKAPNGVWTSTGSYAYKAPSFVRTDADPGRLLPSIPNGNFDFQ